MSGVLATKEEVVDPKEADVVVLNICTVKGNQTALTEVRKTKERYPDKKLVITGCVPDDIVAPIREMAPEAVFLGTHHIQDIHKAVTSEKPYQQLSIEKKVKLNEPRIRKNPLVGIIPISQGCLDACAFCSTRLMKGILYSYPEENILEEVKQAVADGCKEIWLTGQDTACWGFDRKSNLAKLLTKICLVEGDFKIRVGMGNPRHVPRYQEELLQAYEHDKVYKFIHLPLQSGNDEVLKRMKRGHNVQTVVDLAKAFRKRFPKMTISTDVIVGFPEETEAEFNDTIEKLKELQFDTVNIARYAPRQGTKAYDMEDMSGNDKKDRSRQATLVQKEVAATFNQQWIGWEGEALVDKKGAYGGVVARNFSYKPIVIKKDLPLGKTVNVKITSVTHQSLYGVVSVTSDRNHSL